MADTYTQKDMKTITDRLTKEAQIAGLLKPNQELHYTNGSTAVAATLEIKTVKDNDWFFEQAVWLPRFSPKDNKRTQYRMIGAAVDALWGVNTWKKEPTIK